MARSKFIISLLLLLLGNLYTIGQDDTTIVEIPQETTADNTGSDYNEPDTSLYFNQKLVSTDSITTFKNARQFAYAKKLDSLLKSMQQKQELNTNQKQEALSWLERFFGSPITIWVFWILAATFVLVILYKLFFTKGFFQKQSVKSDITELFEEDELLIDADYNKLIESAVADKNYRLAIRYLYLQTIQKLSASGAIVFAVDKTNYQYVREVASKPFKNDFAAVTLHYEYVWYGKFDIDESIFLKLQTEFKQFYNRV